MEKYIKPVDWQWTQGNYGFSVILALKDKDHVSGMQLENYEFSVNVQRGENPKNVYTAPCSIIDTETKKIEYVVRQEDLSLGDEYYYLEVQATHNDPDQFDEEDERRKISSQEVLRVFVRSKKESQPQ